MKKYEFTGETKTVGGVTLKRIRRLYDGLAGGWIESEDNLCQADGCFIYGNALVYGDAQVYGNARVYGDAQVMEGMHVSFGYTTTNLKTDIKANLKSQCNLVCFGDYVIAFKHVRKDLSSLHDSSFKYPSSGIVNVDVKDLSNESCSDGLHFSHPTYWEGNGGEVILMAKILLKNIITIQEGKIRCREAKIIGVSNTPTM